MKMKSDESVVYLSNMMMLVVVIYSRSDYSMIIEYGSG